MRTKLFFFLILLLIPIAMAAQSGIAAICPECGVYLKPEEAKYFDNPHFHRPGCTWVKKKLKNVVPMSEVPSNFSIADRERLYGYGNGLQCPHCLGTNHHDSDCPIGYSQNRAKELLQEAQQTTNESARKRAVWQYQNMENNINILAQAATAYTPSQQTANDTSSQTQSAPSTPAASSSPSESHIVLPGAYIIKNYDKELSFGNGYARALGATMPNGAERWVLINSKGEEVGQFSKIEVADARNGEDEYFLVRDDNGQWGIYNRGGGLMCEPRYESVKLLTALQGESRRPFLDVARRLPNGQVLHGLVDPFIASPGKGEITQCVFEQIELIDRSPAPHGVLAKVKSDGMWGVIDTEDYGTIIIPPQYSYLNTYFTKKGGMYFIMGDGNGLGAYHLESMQEVVPVTNGYSLDKVRNLIDQRDR